MIPNRPRRVGRLWALVVVGGGLFALVFWWIVETGGHADSGEVAVSTTAVLYVISFGLYILDRLEASDGPW